MSTKTKRPLRQSHQNPEPTHQTRGQHIVRRKPQTLPQTPQDIEERLPRHTVIPAQMASPKTYDNTVTTDPIKMIQEVCSHLQAQLIIATPPVLPTLA
jgi:hypothetical protein